MKNKRLWLATAGLAAGKFTISRAAENAGLTIWEFGKYLVETGFKSDYSIEDLERELLELKALK